MEKSEIKEKFLSITRFIISKLSALSKLSIEKTNLLIAILSLIVAALVGWIANQQLITQRLQFTYEQSQKPRLEYSCRFEISEADSLVVSEAAYQLTNDFFERVYNYTRNHPNITYSQAIKAILPMTTPVAFQSFLVKTSIHNTGEVTANKVRVAFVLNSPITGYNVDSLDQVSLIKGGIGQQEVVIQIDRIVAGKGITLTVESKAGASETQLDQIVLESSDPSELDPQEKSFPPLYFPFPLAYFPQMKLIPGQTFQLKTFEVTFQEGQVTNVEGCKEKYFDDLLELQRDLWEEVRKDMGQ